MNRSSTCPTCHIFSTCSLHKACTPDMRSRARALRPSSAAHPAESLLRLHPLRLRIVSAACRPQIRHPSARAPTVSQRKTSSRSCTDIPKNKAKMLDMPSLDYHSLPVQVYNIYSNLYSTFHCEKQFQKENKSGNMYYVARLKHFKLFYSI